MARKGNKAKLNFVHDSESSTGLSAAVLIRNVKPGPLKNDGTQLIARSEFTSAVTVNLGAYRVRPKVAVIIYAELTPDQLRKSREKERTERALAGAPMLH